MQFTRIIVKGNRHHPEMNIDIAIDGIMFMCLANTVCMGAISMRSIENPMCYIKYLGLADWGDEWWMVLATAP